MTSKWDSWLEQLQRALKGGIRVAPANRGAAWTQLVTMPGNLTTATLRGQVRIAPDNAGTPLAAFSFTSITYDAPSDRSSFTASLAAGVGANSTSALPSDTDMDGVEEFPFDILITRSGSPEEVLFGGLLPVIGKVTA